LAPDPAVPLRGAAAAIGVVVWLHPSYASDDPPPAPPVVRRLGALGWDVWRFDRPERDALIPRAGQLAQGTAALRAMGYRQVALVGESRGAFVSLVALSTPGLADSLLIMAPAAHGTRPERRRAALLDFSQAVMQAMAPGALRRGAMAIFRGDPYEPDAPARIAAFRDGLAARGATPLVIDRPAEPEGHGGGATEEFDTRFGACLARFLDVSRPAPAGCPEAAPGPAAAR
jgi:hypothetical protein